MPDINQQPPTGESAKNTKRKEIWGVLHLPAGLRRFRVSRALHWRYWKQWRGDGFIAEFGLPEPCGETVACVGVDEDLTIRLKRPKWFTFQGGDKFRLDQTSGEVRIITDDPDVRDGKRYEVIVTESGIERLPIEEEWQDPTVQ
jgi:hypothetical protein